MDNTNIYLQKMEEMINNDLEPTRLARIHRIMPTTLLANMCVYLFHLRRWTNWRTPTDVWFSEHIHQLVEPRFKERKRENTTVDVLQLMIDAVVSDNKVSVINLF